MRCAICGATDPGKVRNWETNGGTRYGMACRGEHAGLLWEAHFLRATGAEAGELDLLLWRWRRARVESEGRRFDEAPPMSEVERQAAATQAYWGDVLREVS